MFQLKSFKIQHNYSCFVKEFGKLRISIDIIRWIYICTIGVFPKSVYSLLQWIWKHSISYILTLPRSVSVDGRTLRLYLKSRNKDDGSPLVNISANCLAEGTCRTLTWPSATFSRTKWISISTCLVHWCCTGLEER